MSNQAGIQIKPEVYLTVDWRTFAEKIVEVCVQGFSAAFGVGDGLGGISALVGAAGAVKVDSPPGQRAYELFLLSFAWAFDALRLTGESIELDVQAVRAALESARELIADGGYIMSASFLVQPSSLQLYKVIREKFIDNRVAFGLEKSSPAATMRARFDTGFNRAIFEIWSKNAEKFQPLAVALNAPGASANSFEREWDAYRQRLVYDFTVRPVFGQEDTKVALSQLYVPLRGIWEDLADEDRDDTLTSARSAAPKRRHVVSLDSELDGWVNAAKSEDNLRLIGGGPGSGKSTTLRSLASRLAAKPEVRPLYVPLQHIDIGLDLRAAVNNYFVNRTNGAFRQPPLAREALEDGPTLVLIFDGLDELARPGEGAVEVAGLFVSKLTQLMGALRGDGDQVTLYVVSGRMPSFQAARKYLSADGPRSFSVSGFCPIVPTAELKGATELIRLDQRPQWWGRYSRVADLAAALPQAMADPRFADITNEPLLCYLLALSGYATTNWEEAADNRNRIYARLIEEVWERAWGDGPGKSKRQGPGRTLSRGDFIRLMETIALAAWRGGDTRVASEERFIETTKLSKTNDIWETFKSVNGPDVGNLALNFYLKSAESERRGFEFTHKSFGDYLVARAIYRLAFELQGLVERRIELAASEWLLATGQGELTEEILFFLRDEMRLHFGQDGSSLQSLKHAFELLVSFAITDGFPSQVGNSVTWRMAEKSQNNAESIAWAVLSSAAHALPQCTIHVKWPDAVAFGKLVARLLPRDMSAPRPIRLCFSRLDCSGADLFLACLRSADLSGAILDGASLDGADFLSADLSSASLKRASLDRTHLDAADLRFASLKDAKLIDTNVARARFQETEITGATFSPELRKRFGVATIKRDLPEEKGVAGPGVLNTVPAENPPGARNDRSRDDRDGTKVVFVPLSVPS